jgi:hypothetical protein
MKNKNIDQNLIDYYEFYEKLIIIKNISQIM